MVPDGKFAEKEPVGGCSGYRRAGIGGMQAALDAGRLRLLCVRMAEKKPAIGGVMAQLDKTFPTNDCSMCIMRRPKLVECGRHLNIEVITNSEVAGVQGVAGGFYRPAGESSAVC